MPRTTKVNIYTEAELTHKNRATKYKQTLNLKIWKYWFENSMSKKISIDININ